MKLAPKIFFGTLGLAIAGIVIASVVMKVEKNAPPKDPGIKRGLIDSVWMELPRHDVKLLAPGVWGEAWLDTMYFMRIFEPGKREYRTVELYKQSYLKYKNSRGEFIQLESDSATVIENQAEWDKDSIKYQEVVKRMQKARNR